MNLRRAEEQPPKHRIKTRQRTSQIYVKRVNRWKREFWRVVRATNLGELKETLKILHKFVRIRCAEFAPKSAFKVARAINQIVMDCVRS